MNVRFDFPHIGEWKSKVSERKGNEGDGNSQCENEGGYIYVMDIHIYVMDVCMENDMFVEHEILSVLNEIKAIFAFNCAGLEDILLLR